MGDRGTLHKIALALEHEPRALRAELELALMAHPSETGERVVLRALAYCIEYVPELELGPALCRADEPALYRQSAGARYDPWVELGEPDPERVRRALSRCERLVVVSAEPSRPWCERMAETRWPRKARVERVTLERGLVRALAAGLERRARWTVRVEDARLTVGAAQLSLAGGYTRERLGSS